MPSIDDYKPAKKFFGLFAGQSGSGKSAAASSFPEPYHELDTDERFAGIYGAVKNGLVKNTKITFEQFQRFGGWEPIDKALQQLVIHRIQASNNSRAFPYNTIGLGSVTSLVRSLGNMARRELKGQVVGTLRLPAPGDIRVENMGVHTVLDYLKDMPCNVIVTAHIIERWGKPPIREEADNYKPNIIIGEKLNLNDNLSSSILSEFDNVFRFERKIISNKECYFVEFCTDFAKNSYGIPPGEFDITNIEFFPWFQRLLEEKDKRYEVLKKVK